MQTLLKILVALLIIGVVVAFHEFGHFIIAKSRGIAVSEFSIGMGPRLYSFTKGGTKYSLKLLPIGGSCMMGEDDVAAEDDRTAFNNKNVWERIAVIFAGPFFNFILAFVFAIIVIGCVGYDPAYVLSVDESFGQEIAVGDTITKINNKKISISRDIVTYFYFHPIDGNEITIEYKHPEDDKTFSNHSLTVKPELIEKYMLGFQYSSVPESKPLIDSVIAGYPLEKAGILAGDLITAIDDHEINSGSELSEYLAKNPLNGKQVKFSYMRNGESFDTMVTPISTSDYSIGFTYNSGFREKTTFFRVIRYSFNEVKYWIQATFASLGQLITGKVSSDEIGGPVRIVSEIGNVVEESKKDGFGYIVLNLLNWAILLSANLGVMNLLPIPALDGGRLVFLFIEVFRGKPIAKEKEGMVHLIGIILLMILMVFIFFNDIKNVFFR